MRAAPLQVLNARPPIFDKIVAVLPGAAGAGVMFAYAGVVYAPGGTKVSRELDEHERVHIERQGADAAGWWDRYLTDLDFRFEEELLAHRAEYQSYIKRHADAVKRHRRLKEIAAKLASPLYGRMTTQKQAEVLVGLPEGVAVEL